MTSGKWIVYALVDPRTGERRYVGTTDRPERRRMEHRLELLKPGPDSAGDARLKWFAELRNANSEFLFEVLERLGSKQAALRAEARQIRRALKSGAQLVNIQVAAKERKRKPSPVQRANARAAELQERLSAAEVRAATMAVLLRALLEGAGKTEAFRAAAEEALNG